MLNKLCVCVEAAGVTGKLGKMKNRVAKVIGSRKCGKERGITDFEVNENSTQSWELGRMKNPILQKWQHYKNVLIKKSRHLFEGAKKVVISVLRYADSQPLLLGLENVSFHFSYV